MDERDANIDVLFRNGLKDYEALPPQDVWDTISPVIRQRQKPVIFFRYAATVAVLISVGLLAYKWNLEMAGDLVADRAVQPTAPQTVVSEPAINQPLAVSIPLPSQIQAPVRQVNDRESETPISVIELNPEKALQEAETQYHLTTNRNATASETVIPDAGTALNSLFLYPGDELAETNAKVVKQRWAVSALVSPTYYNRLSSGNNEALAQVIASDKPQISYTGGFAMSYKISRRLSVQSGIYYASIGQDIQNVSAYSGFAPYDYTKGTKNFAIQTVNGMITTSNGDVFLADNLEADRVITRFTNDVFDPGKAELQYINNSVHQSFSYLEVPVFVKYKLLDKGIDVNIIGGLASNVLVNNSVYTPVNGEKYQIGETENLNNLIFSSSLGMGMEYNVSGNLSLNLEPTLRYYLNPFSQITGMKVHPYSFGIFSGLTYKF